MVRHGESTWNVEGRIQGNDDTSRLTARGRDQAAAAAAGLVERGFEVMVSSDLARARETAKVIGDVLGLEAHFDRLLRERHYGTFEGGPVRELMPSFRGNEDGVVVDPDAAPPGGESLRDVVTRADGFLDVVRARWPSTRLLVVTHGGVIRATSALLSGRVLLGFELPRVPNASAWDFIAPAHRSLEADV